MVTEVNLNSATYIKFDQISNAQVEPIKPSSLADPSQAEPQDGQQTAGTSRKTPLALETSFDVQLALNSAIGRLNTNADTNSNSKSISISNLNQIQQTPTLGKCNSSSSACLLCHFRSELLIDKLS